MMSIGNRGTHRIFAVRDVINHVGQYVNLVGVAIEFSIPYRSHGTDYCTILKIIDDSQQDPELCINIFAANINDLPHIHSRQDIIILANVQIRRSHDTELSAVFNKYKSSFAVFNRKLRHGFTPYQASQTFSIRDFDMRFLTALKDWSLTSHFDAGLSGYTRSVKDVKEGGHIDLVCQVIYVYEASKDNWVLFIWDGTDAPSLSLNRELLDEEQRQQPVRSSQHLPGTVLHSFPHVGTVLRVDAYRGCELFERHFKYVSKWMRIRNLLCRLEDGMWNCSQISNTKFRLLSKKDNSVQECLRNLEKRIIEHGRIPVSSCHLSNFITVTDNERKCMTLMDLLTLSQPQRGEIIQCVVRVVAIYPSQAKDFCSPTSGEYRIRMTIEDPTAIVQALLCGQDAKTFFGEHSSVDALTSMRNKLLGVPKSAASSMDPPWIKCCIDIRSSETTGSRHYHICHTKLVV